MKKEVQTFTFCWSSGDKYGHTVERKNIISAADSFSAFNAWQKVFKKEHNLKLLWIQPCKLIEGKYEPCGKKIDIEAGEKLA